MKKEDEKMKSIGFNFYQYVWIFITSCLVGYAVETVWCLIKHGYIESRKSLVIGHLSIAYGMGAVLLTLLLVHFQNSKTWKVFIIAFVAGTVTEYICSLGQEICFGSVAWDYSNVPLNINGRVCLLYSLFWGVLGVGWVKLMLPFMNNIFHKVNIPYQNVIIWGFLAFFIFDCALSASAALRMNQRAEGIEAKNSIEVFLDKHYSDEKMHQIYANSQSTDK